MIPSEFNLDSMAQRRKLYLLREARRAPEHKPVTTGPANRRTWLEASKPLNEFNWFVFRGVGIGGSLDEIAGPFKTFEKAAAEGKKIAAKTGEPLRLKKNPPQKAGLNR